MMEMSFRNGIDLIREQGPASTAGRNFNISIPDGFKTGIEKERLVSIGYNWYRFAGLWTCVKTRIGEASFYGC